MRYFVTSILDIQEKIKKEEVAQEKIQRTVEEHLKQVVHKNTFVGHDFKDLIERGADPMVELDGIEGMEDGEGKSCSRLILLTAGLIVIRNGILYRCSAQPIRECLLLGKDRNKSARAETTKRAIRREKESPNPDVFQFVLMSLSGLRTQAEFQQEIQAEIPMAVFQQEIRAAIPMVGEWLKDSNSDVPSGIPAEDPDRWIHNPLLPSFLQISPTTNSAIEGFKALDEVFHLFPDLIHADVVKTE
ncbi:hypothetical protein DFH08DRAFT_811121 [Mycena albidolilacea]|uniref:Uncharacterized protein n=1 Tax=Mycena albidolilacea TaxID=1033008 RepID=A0AAD7ENE7_9AGAR|nr:hypothetical protein DFH08DRAFT_811121 [Mycena albidolilacea]